MRNDMIIPAKRELIAARPGHACICCRATLPTSNPLGFLVPGQTQPSNLGAGSPQRLVALIRNRLKSLQYRAHNLSGLLAKTGLNLKPP